MSTAFTIWMIGFAFTYGFVTADGLGEGDRDFWFRVFCIAVCAVFWPAFLGTELHKHWYGKKGDGDATH